MATKSILKNISIRDSKVAKKFVIALEAAERRPNKKVTMSRTVQRLAPDKIQDFFGDI